MELRYAGPEMHWKILFDLVDDLSWDTICLPTNWEERDIIESENEGITDCHTKSLADYTTGGLQIWKVMSVCVYEVHDSKIRKARTRRQNKQITIFIIIIFCVCFLHLKPVNLNLILIFCVCDILYLQIRKHKNIYTIVFLESLIYNACLLFVYNS